MNTEYRIAEYMQECGFTLEDAEYAVMAESEIVTSEVRCERAALADESEYTERAWGWDDVDYRNAELPCHVEPEPEMDWLQTVDDLMEDEFFPF